MVFTPRAKRVIELAFEEARQLNHNYIGTEHLLLALISDDTGAAARVLARCDVELPGLRGTVLALAGQGDGQ
jgi:ATP-dependent Clp protease ATP-binding subunit ClpC